MQERCKVMGDRAMAEIKTDGGSLYVYTHWGGNELYADTVKAVTAAKPRWDDRPYATRIIVDQLTKGGRDGETGFGLLLEPQAEDEYNDDNPSVVIDLIHKTITVWRHGESDIQSFEEV